MDDLSQLRDGIKTEAIRLGFSHTGIAPALPVPHYQEYEVWLRAGHHASMHYLARADTLKKRGNPRLILENCQSIICLAMPYQRPQHELSEAPPGKGRVSSYAITQDYHQVIWDKLHLLEEWIQSNTGHDVQTKTYVDTGPILERSFASEAGIGIAGKNSCLLIQGTGSYFFLAEILINLDLPVDNSYTRDLCGTCRRCIDACPTACILPNRTIDARRCISFLTIENKGEVHDDLKTQMGTLFFGCDICQIVCPHNAWTPEQTFSLGERLVPEFIDLVSLFSYDETNFVDIFGQTPVSRAKRMGVLRNAAIVLGNQKYLPALATLKKALANEKDPAVQDACRWAIQQIEAPSSIPTNKD